MLSDISTVCTLYVCVPSHLLMDTWLASPLGCCGQSHGEHMCAVTVMCDTMVVTIIFARLHAEAAPVLPKHGATPAGFAHFCECDRCQ